MLKKIPHTFTIVFSLILLASILTWIIPSGEYDRETKIINGTERSIAINNSYHKVEAQPQTWEIFSAFYKGFVDKGNIIVFILIVGGAFWILNSTKAIDIGIMAFLRKIQKLQHIRLIQFLGINNIIMSLIMLVFSLFGAIFGMSEETIAFVIVFVPLAISMGYDSITGLCLCYLAAHVGFAGAILNPFTIGIAQGIAGLPLFSGIGYRVFCWIILTILCIVFVLLYAARIKRNPQKSLTYEIDAFWRNRAKESEAEPVHYHTPYTAWLVWGFLSVVMLIASFKFPITHIKIGADTHDLMIIPVLAGLFAVSNILVLRKSVHFFILNLLIFTIAFLIVGVLGYGWYIEEIAALFFAMGIFSGLAYKTHFDKLMKLFLEGAKDIMNAALVVGLASGIIFILQDGKVLDTILYGLSNSLSNLGEAAAVSVMYVFQTGLNLIMPSGSAKAALTMPLLSQFSDLIGVSRQVTVLAFQFGDGFTHMITPVSGVLLGCLGVARVPYEIWLRWIWKFTLILFFLGFILLLPTLYLNLAGF